MFQVALKNDKLDVKQTAKNAILDRVSYLDKDIVLNIETFSLGTRHVMQVECHRTEGEGIAVSKEILRIVRSAARQKKSVSIGKGYYDITKLVTEWKNEKLQVAYDALMEIETISDGIQHALSDLRFFINGEQFDHEKGEFVPMSQRVR